MFGGYCPCGPVVLEKTVVPAPTVVDPGADPARVAETVVATGTVFELRVLSRLVAKVADWCWEHSMPRETLD